MADINREDIVIFKSEVLDETDDGGGQMTSQELTNGEINGLFPDISLMDSVYGRVSLRKCFVAVNTSNRATYYGSHLILTKKAEDPFVSILFFTTKDWFDKRDQAQSRIENYKGKGTTLGAALWGNHYYGSKIAMLQTSKEWPDPEIGDVIVFETDEDLNGTGIPLVQQYLRIMDVSSEVRSFTIEKNNAFHTFVKKIVSLIFGQILQTDFPGTEVFATTDYATTPTKIYTSVDVDAARYYGVTKLAADEEIDDLVIVVDDVKKSIVPAAQSETGIVDYSIGKTTSMVLQTQLAEVPVSKTMAFSMYNGNTFIIGEAIRQGTFSIPSEQISDDGTGNVIKGSTIVGSILYETGYVSWVSLPTDKNFSGTVEYVPGCVSAQLGYTGGVFITSNNRGFVYTFACSPVPVPGSVKLEYMVNGKWYSMWDSGNGLIRGSSITIGTAVVNFTTGSISISLGEMPDLNSYLLVTWSDKSDYTDLSGVSVPFCYDFYLEDDGITPGTLSISWTQDSVLYSLTDNSAGVVMNGATPVGTINYGNGKVVLNALQVTPPNNQTFDIAYDRSNIIEREFVNPGRSGTNRIVLDLNNTNNISPGSIIIEWTNILTRWTSSQLHNHIIQKQRDFVHKYSDKPNTNPATGYLDKYNTANYTTEWTPATIDYATGILSFSPDRKETVALNLYDFVNTAI